MANLKSSKKDIRRTKKRTQANASLKSKVRTFLRKAKETIVSCKDYKEGYSAIVAYEKVAMTSAKHNVFSKKSISRHISSLVKTLKGRFSQTEQVVA